MYYPDNIIEQVREQSDIISTISEYTHLTQKGSSHFGLCPFHNEKSPSFSVSEEKQMYYCFGCGAGGNIFTFLMQKENMTFVEALTHLAERAHIDIESFNTGQAPTQNKKNELLEIHKIAGRFYYYALGDENAGEVREYLNQRGIGKEIIKKFGIGYAPADYTILYKYLRNQGYSDEILLESGLILKSKKSGVFYDRFSDRVMFPIFNTNKKVIAFGGRIIKQGEPKYLNSPESLLFDKSRNLYGLHLARAEAHPYYILVEGYMDVIAMHKAGFTQTVASLGTAFTVGHAKLLKRYTNELVILYDSDAAGEKAALRAMPILRAEGINVRILQLSDSKDPDEFLGKHGKEEMEELLNHAKSDTWFKVMKLEQNYDIREPEQKVKFLQEVAKVIGELSSSIEQNIYTKEIAIRYKIDEIALEAEIKNYYNNKLQVKNQETKSKPIMHIPMMTSNIQLAFLSTIYHYPYVFNYIKEYVDPELFDEGLLQELAKQVFDSITNQTQIDIGHFNNAYTDLKEQNMISNVFMNKDMRYEDQELLQKMLTETIKRLNILHIEKKLKTSIDILEVQKLLSRKKVLDKLYIEFING
ncbi:MAG: DNA primase [Cellulosilyticaceae bacterium]